jgi:hypothetical protein
VDRWACIIEKNCMCMVGEDLLGYAEAFMAMLGGTIGCPWHKWHRRLSR